ncbi:hypothetical protein TNCV_2613971 [Trichonephila clavipes]|nr:hypothetical protein TNCV_2613971 [Trichonephila clavipes]
MVVAVPSGGGVARIMPEMSPINAIWRNEGGEARTVSELAAAPLEKSPTVYLPQQRRSYRRIDDTGPPG